MTLPIRPTAEPSLEEPITEESFLDLLQGEAEPFFQLANTLLARSSSGKPWQKSHFARLVNETDSLESFLDDYGARYNRNYADFTELVASLRWFARAGYAIGHLLSRLGSYGDDMWSAPESAQEAQEAIEHGAAFLERTANVLLEELRHEGSQLGLRLPAEVLPDTIFVRPESRLTLPRNVGQEQLQNEEQKIAEVCTKFLQAAEMVAAVGVRSIEEDSERHEFVAQVCTEEKARVYESTVHNLQSTYDTHIRNTVLEGRDPRLVRLRGNASAALHLLQAVTHLAHFLERHEGDLRPAACHRRVSELVDRAGVEEVVVNNFLLWAHQLLQNGTDLAHDLLPSYTDLGEIELELPEGAQLHARPAALIVAVVNHHGTPVELELGGQRCDAGSILKILVTAGSHPDERRYVFRGDLRPLEDIRKLFRHGLGEQGTHTLPPELDYLRSD